MVSNKVKIVAVCAFLFAVLLPTFTLYADDYGDTFLVRKGFRPLMLTGYRDDSEAYQFVDMTAFSDHIHSVNGSYNVQDSSYQNVVQLRFTYGVNADFKIMTHHQFFGADEIWISFEDVWFENMDQIVNGNLYSINDMLNELSFTVNSELLTDTASVSFTVTQYKWGGDTVVNDYYFELNQDLIGDPYYYGNTFILGDYFSLASWEIGDLIQISDIKYHTWLLPDRLPMQCTFNFDTSLDSLLLDYDTALDKLRDRSIYDIDEFGFVDSLIETVDGVLDFELFDGFTLRGVLTLIVAISGFVLFLKIFAGG